MDICFLFYCTIHTSIWSSSFASSFCLFFYIFYCHLAVILAVIESIVTLDIVDAIRLILLAYLRNVSGVPACTIGVSCHWTNLSVIGLICWFMLVVHQRSPSTIQNTTKLQAYTVTTICQIKNVVEFCWWGRGPSHRSGVATLDGDTKALEEESDGTRLWGCGSNPTAEVADEPRRFLSQRTQCLDGDWDEVVRRRERAVLGPLPSFSLRGHGAWSRWLAASVSRQVKSQTRHRPSSTGPARCNCVIMCYLTLARQWVSDWCMWWCCQATQCVLCICLVVGLICRFKLVADTVEKLRSTYFEEFVDVSDVEYCDKVTELSAT